MTAVPHLKEYRCPTDNKLLFRGVLIESDVEIKCRNCKQLITIKGIPADQAICKKIDCVNRVR